jgi:large subunit ribosomal protein L5e
MAFIKVQKSRQYYKRFQTKFRRRRETKTDYYARKRMVLQDANKYGTPKYRLVTRFSNSRINAQIVYSTIKGDKVLSSCDSGELAQWGLTTGQSSYAAAYATGLLIARRLLKQLKLDTLYKGVKETTGTDYDVSAEAETFKNDKRPFKAILDIGLANNTVGHRVFAVLKGATDGGLHVPHNTRKFYGSGKNEETKDWEYSPEANRDRVFGVHIDNYMSLLKEKGAESFKKQFGKWDAALKAAKVASVQELFKKIHAAIRATPERKKKERKATPQTYEDKDKTVIKTKKGKYLKNRRLTREQRKARIQTKIKIATQKK